MRHMHARIEMETIIGDIWEEASKRDAYVVVPTNGFIKNNGCAVMGRGLAKQASDRYPGLAYSLGDKIRDSGNKVHVFPEIKVITFPVKYNWWENANVDLIDESAVSLKYFMLSHSDNILIPHVGCGNGRLIWEIAVKPIIENRLSGLPNLIVCDRYAARS